MNHRRLGQFLSTTKGAVLRPYRVHRRSTTAVLITALALLTSIMAVVAPSAANANATAATPPFTQCPAVGASPTCAILVVINGDRTVSVYHDPGVGPYDGGDDTLVGVQNDSSAPVDAITVTGPGTGLGGLDGDGLCTFGVTGCPFGLVGCPSASTGYEGPGTCIVTDPSQRDSAEIDFPQAGLQAGSHTFFSLEGALTTAVLTARQGHIAGMTLTKDFASSANEPVVAVNPSNHNNIVVAFNHISNGKIFCGYKYTSDGGQTWVGPVDLALPKADQAAGSGDPSLAFTSSGRLYFSCLVNADVDGVEVARNLYAAVSDDGGATFGPSRILVQGNSQGAGPDQEQLGAALGGGPAYMCYTYYTAGVTANSGVIVSQLGVTDTSGGPAPVIAQRASVTAGTHQANPVGCTVSVAPSGRVWAGWWDSSYGTKPDPSRLQAFAAYSDNSAASFTGVTSLGIKYGLLWDSNLGVTFTPERRVYIQASPTPGDNRVLAVWENVYSGQDTIQQAVFSGGTWTAPTTIATDATQPSIAWGTDGKVAYGYYSNPNKDGSQLSFQLAQTSGPAAGPLTPAQAPEPPSSELTGLDPFSRFGDYNGVAEANGTAYAAWTDNNGGRQTITFGYR
jgi:hypothetical protein